MSSNRNGNQAMNELTAKIEKLEEDVNEALNDIVKIKDEPTVVQEADGSPDVGRPLSVGTLVERVNSKTPARSFRWGRIRWPLARADGQGRRADREAAVRREGRRAAGSRGGKGLRGEAESPE